jgi:prepilin-type N-terminal cleavage/methylation domain-containing protein
MNKKGFTLIELLIVVVIIGILAAIAIPRFGETRERAYVSAMQSDLNQLRTAMEMYYQDNTYDYTGAVAADLITETDGVTVTVDAADATSWSATATHASSDQECTYDSDVGTIDCDVPAAP